MSLSNENILNKEFDAMVHKIFVSEGYRLRGTTRVKTSNDSKVFQFRKVGSVTANEYAPQTTVVYQDPNYAAVDVTAKRYRAPIIIDDYDQFITNVNERQEDAMLVADAVGRRFDQIILDALINSGTTNTIADGSSNFTYDKFTEIIEFFEDKAVPIKNRHVVTSASGARSLLKQTNFISNDFLGKGAVKNGTMAGRDLLGCNVHIIPTMDEGGLGKSGNIRTCWAWHQSSVGMVQTGPIKSILERVPGLDSWQVLGKIFANAVAIDATGIVQFDIDESA